MNKLALAVSVFLVVSGARAQGLVVAVNDGASHGLVGDGLLSLDEAIRLANGSLPQTALSAAEQGQIGGIGTTVAEIRVDPAIVPTVTLQAPLTDIVGGGAAAGRLTIGGMFAGSATKAVIQGGTETHGFAIRDHDVTITGFRIVGAQVGIDAALPALSGPMVMARIMHCELDGQATAGVKLHASGLEESLLMTMHTDLSNMPIGFLVEDQSAGGRLMGECEFVTFDGVDVGFDVLENGSGNLSMVMLFRSTFGNGITLAKKRRAPASTQAFMFRFTHMKATCTGDVVDVEGGPNGLTMVHHHTSDWIAGTNQHAFKVHPRTALFDVHGSEMYFKGDVSIAGNPFTQRVWQQNNQYHMGTVTYDVDGALPNLLWNQYADCTVRVPATATSPVVVRQSEFYNTHVDGQSAFAPLTLDGCYRGGGWLNGNATETNPAPSVIFGHTVISPLDPIVGQTIDLQTWLPHGLGLVWIFAYSYPRPTTTIEPVRFYGDPATAIVLPGMVVFQSTTSVPLPNNPALADVELYVQGVTLPLLNQWWMPDYHLPRGELVRPRL